MESTAPRMRAALACVCVHLIGATATDYIDNLRAKLLKHNIDYSMAGNDSNTPTTLTTVVEDSEDTTIESPIQKHITEPILIENFYPIVRRSEGRSNNQIDIENSILPLTETISTPSNMQVGRRNKGFNDTGEPHNNKISANYYEPLRHIYPDNNLNTSGIEPLGFHLEVSVPQNNNSHHNLEPILKNYEASDDATVGTIMRANQARQGGPIILGFNIAKLNYDVPLLAKHRKVKNKTKTPKFTVIKKKKIRKIKRKRDKNKEINNDFYVKAKNTENDIATSTGTIYVLYDDN